MRAAAADGPNVGMPRCAKRVSDARGERCFGSDDDEVDALTAREIDHARDVGRRHGHTTRELRDARISRCSEELESWIVALRASRRGRAHDRPRRRSVPSRVRRSERVVERVARASEHVTDLRERLARLIAVIAGRVDVVVAERLPGSPRRG